LTPPQPTSSGKDTNKKGKEPQKNEEVPLDNITVGETKEDEVPSSLPSSIKIRNFDKEEWPKKKTKKQNLEDGINYDKIHLYALIPFP
jgi:hypothetical protein